MFRDYNTNFERVHLESRWCAPEDEEWLDVGGDDSESDGDEYEDNCEDEYEAASGGGSGGIGSSESNVGVSRWRQPPVHTWQDEWLPPARPMATMVSLEIESDCAVAPPAPVPTVSQPMPFNLNKCIGWKRSVEDLKILRVEPNSQAYHAGVL